MARILEFTAPSAELGYLKVMLPAKYGSYQTAGRLFINKSLPVRMSFFFGHVLPPLELFPGGTLPCPRWIEKMGCSDAYDSENGVIDFTFDANWGALVLLVIYYFLDWFSSVFTIRNDNRITYYHLYLFVMSNIVLCIAILFAIKNSCLLFLIFGCYSFFVPFWDFFVSARMLENSTKKNPHMQSTSTSMLSLSLRSLGFQFKFVTSFRFIFGLVLIIIAGSSLIFFGENNVDAQYVSYATLFCIVGTKWIRMILLFRSVQA